MDQTLRQTLSREVQCRICLNTFTNPKILPCLHTFCKDCIKRHSDRSGNGNTFSCAVCKATTDVPEGNDFDKLPDNFAYNNLINALAASKSQPLCKEKYHENEPLKFYCETCDWCICQSCVATKLHKYHEILTVDEASTEQKKVFLQQKENLERKSTEVRDTLLDLQKAEQQLEEFSDKAEKDVDRFTDEILALVEENKANLKLKIQQQKQETSKKLKDETFDHKEFMQQLNDMCKFTDDIAQGTPHDIMEVKKAHQEGCARLLDSTRVRSQANPFILFVPSNNTQTFRDTGLGMVTNASLTDPCEDLLQALSPVQLGINSDAIKYKVLPEKDVKDVKICDQEGEVGLKFTAKVPGEYTVEGRINGAHIPNSPMQITIEPQVMQGSEEQFEAEDVEIKRPDSIAVNSDSTRIAITDWETHSIFVMNLEGEVQMQISRFGKSRLKKPCGIAFMKSSAEVVVGDYGNNHVRVFNHENGSHVWSKKFPFTPIVAEMMSVHVNEVGDVIVGATCLFKVSDYIAVYDAMGAIKYTLNVDEMVADSCVTTCCITYADLWIISDRKNNCIHVTNTKDTSKYRRIGRQGDQDGEFECPVGLAVDGDGNLLVCDVGNSRIRKFALDDGRYIGESELISGPYNLAVLLDGRAMVIECAGDLEVVCIDNV